MGFFNDLYQSYLIDETAHQATTLEARVQKLERELARTNRLLRDVILLLETQTQRDLNGDGTIG